MWRTSRSPPTSPLLSSDKLPRASIAHLLSKLSCPLLGLFGAEDPAPPPDEVKELADALTSRGKEFEFEIYENAGHAFFSVDSQKYRTTAALAGWQRVLGWFGRHLGGDPDTGQA